MKKEYITQMLLLAIFVIFAYVYFEMPTFFPQIDKIYITITTFFFSIFTGFFVSQQMSRYSKIREIIANFDGKMSSTYRSAGNIDTDFQAKVGKIIEEHYKTIIKTKEWDYHFTHKSNTISSIHDLIEEQFRGIKLESVQLQSIGKIINNMSDCEVARKNMVMLYQEHIPRFQWFIIVFFIFTLITTVSAIPSEGLILESILKSAFAVSILSIASILYKLNQFHLFEHFIGEHSAQDVLKVIEGKS